jgi:hypothetical protein
MLRAQMKNYKNIITLILFFFISGDVMAVKILRIKQALNILGTKLKPCCANPATGFFRDGYCNTSDIDTGKHVVCAVVNKKFLDFTKLQGNDLTTANLQKNFHGLKPGDSWCLCALRWQEAHESGCAPPIKPEATHIAALNIIDEELLQKYYIINH